MPKSTMVEPFVVAPDDPLAAEHAAVMKWVEDALGTLNEQDFYVEVDLKLQPSGAALLAGDPEQSRRIVMAAVAQVKYWDNASSKIRDGAENERQRNNVTSLPSWKHVQGRRWQAMAVAKTLMRRSLPFDRADLLELIEWCDRLRKVSSFVDPAGPTTRALQRHAACHNIDAELGDAMKHFAIMLRTAPNKEVKKLGTVIEQLIARDQPVSFSESDRPARPSPQPAPAGSPYVLDQLKRVLGIAHSEVVPATTVIEPDLFPLCDESPLRFEHEILSAAFREFVGTTQYYRPDLQKFATGRELLALPPTAMGRAVLAAAERHVNALVTNVGDLNAHAVWQTRYSTGGVAEALLDCEFELDRNGRFELLLYFSTLSAHQRSILVDDYSALIAAVEREAALTPLTEGERFVLSLFRGALVSGPALGAPSPEVKKLTELIGDGLTFYLAPGEAWADAVNRDIMALPGAEREQWANLLRHALAATASRPAAKWLKTSGQLIAAIGPERVREALLRWFPEVAHGRTIQKLGQYSGDTRGGADTMHEENGNCLRGLLWCVPLLPRREELARTVTAVALSAYKKVPGVGPRAVKVGNAAVYALSELASNEAVGQLAMLKVRVRFGTAQKEIEKAFTAAADTLGLPREQIEELGVPTYGLEEVGRRVEQFGAYRAELQVTGSDAAVQWFDANGKALKSVPAKVKSEHKEDLKDLQQSLKDIQSMLPAQRDRIDGMFLLQKSWPIAEWRERYHDHPLVGTIARRLIWCVDGAPALFTDGVPTDVQGRAIEHGKTAEVTPWHPVGRPVEEITAWRRRLEELGITQPFKQAYREVYLLTDAERNTRTYSNRFAAHVIRQHQFNALCAARGWKNKLRLMVDDCYPPASRELPLWGLRAEFWIEGIGDNFGVDTNEAGSFLRLSTDQVRFHRIGSAESLAHAGGGGYERNAAGPGQDNINEPVPLEDVPPLVFSEIMRDVDLFVGVASVGNDPTWQDGGPQGRYREYWHNYSFGELSGTATTRKQVLERLVPRLKIANRCSLGDRFLVVRGDKRTYKIHLGSGNILMEPNDQYLCIVPDARARASEKDLYLPFEGDAVLSIIISKALLLADDTKIKDPTITRQIDGK